MNTFSFVMPYYENPQMLRIHVDNWNSYPAKLRERVRVVLIDDGSPEHPAAPIFQQCTLKKGLWRINENIPWNQHGARNLGAKVMGKDEAWGLFTDMDIVLMADVVEALLAKKWNPGRHYTFDRAFFDGRPNRAHCNTFLVTRDAYWRAGGYNEEFCGAYGGDGIFIRALQQVAPAEYWPDIVVRGMNDVVPDCSTREWGRKGTKYHEEYLRRRDALKNSGGFKSKDPLRFTWQRVL